MAFQPPKSKIPTKFGGDDEQNALQLFMLKQALTSQQIQGEVGSSGQSARDIASQFPNNIAPVGSTLTGKGQANIELNKPLPEAAESTLRLGRTQASNLKSNLDQLIGSKNLQSRTTPFNPSAHSGFVGNLSLQIEGLRNSPDVSEFASFKSGTEQLFQQYRKYITGVQAGFPELQMLQPIFPTTSDPPSNYVSKALQALDTMKRNEETLLDFESQRGYQVENLKGTFPVNSEDIRSSALQKGIAVSGSVSVTNGKRTFTIPSSKLSDAQARGYYRV